MLRIHFTGADLGRTRLAAGPQPLWEILLSLHKLGDRDGGVIYDSWRRGTRARLTGETRWLCEIAPPRGYSPDFLTACGGGELPECLDRVLSTPRARIRADLSRLTLRRRSSSPVAALATANVPALRALGSAIGAYHRDGLGPCWELVQAAVRTDLARRAETLLRSGVETMLAGLLRDATWRQPVLEAPYPVDRDLHLGGRGLLLVPSYFCWDRPVTLHDPDLDPVLVYPITHDLDRRRPSARTTTGRALAALLGRTRATVLTTISLTGCTTSQLAHRVGVSIGSASQHATVLREAGLITTHRQGGRVIHTITTAGTTLINSNGGAQP